MKVYRKIGLFCSNVVASLRRAVCVDALVEPLSYISHLTASRWVSSWGCFSCIMGIKWINQNWYSHDSQRVYSGEKLSKRAIYFITSFTILYQILCSIMGKSSGKTKETYWMEPLKLLIKYYFITLLKQSLFPGCLSFCGKNLRGKNLFLIED